MASSDNPKANEMPVYPILSPARTALPTPPNTSTNVPISSAMNFFMLSHPTGRRADQALLSTSNRDQSTASLLGGPGSTVRDNSSCILAFWRHRETATLVSVLVRGL